MNAIRLLNKIKIVKINPKIHNFCTLRKFSNKVEAKDNVSPETSTKKTLTVAVIGVPNAGKSTFINNLIKHRVCPTSSKVHTTNKATKAICTVQDTQLVLFDTPGLVTQKEIEKHHLGSTFTSSYRHSIQHADLITIIHDVSNRWTRNELDKTVLESLQAYPKLPSILVLNKIDTLKSKRFLLDLIKILTNNRLSADKSLNKRSRTDETIIETKFVKNKIVGWSNFSEIFMVSSITGNGLEAIMKYFLKNAKSGSWDFTSETFTDISPEELIVDSVRARLLDYLPQEIPYTLTSRLEYYSTEKNVIYAYIEIACPNQRIEKLLCGAANGKLKQITERVTSDLVETFKTPISLTIATVVKKSA